MPNLLCALNNIENFCINKTSIDKQAKWITEKYNVVNTKTFNIWLIKAITLIDLTTLAADDTRSHVNRLCIKAANPLPASITDKLGLKDKFVLRTAAVCVYPNMVKHANESITRLGLVKDIQIAAVATGFPTGLYPLESRLLEIKNAVADGATEIDVVLDRSLVLTGQWDLLYEELKHMRNSCGDAHLKVILAIGELGTYDNIYKASMISMMAGADFIKTSTGKESVNATLPAGLIMCRAIRRFYQLTGKKVGLKPAGGIKTCRDVVNWMCLVKYELGSEWLSPNLFRIGASSLLDSIVEHLRQNPTKLTN